MKVRDLMTGEVEFCRPENNLAEAAAIMWRCDCGIVPVVDVERRLMGVVTDRDICMAVVMRNRLASEISVGEVMAGPVRSCNAADDVSDALDAMAREQLRRLPVVNADGTLAGILSLSDVVLHSERGKSKKHVSHGEAMAALKAIAKPRTRAEAETTHEPLPNTSASPAQTQTEPPIEGNS